MSYLGSWAIDNVLTFYANTTRFDTGNATDADAVPAYRVYEDETATPILTGNMALLDSANTAGFYSEQITLSAANGFEKGKSYAIYIAATVNSIAGSTHHTLQIEAEVDANRLNWANVDNPTTAINLSATNIDVDQIVASVSGAVGSVTARVTANVDQLGGVAQSLTDLKDFADDGYDPATNKVQGVVLTDTLTTYTGNTPQTGDSFARIGATGSGLTTLASQASVDTIDNLVDDLESRLGSPSNLGGGATIAANLADIEGQTDDIGAAGAGLTALGDTRIANLDAAISSRASQASLDTVDNLIDTEIADILARLPAALVSGRMDSNMQAAANGVITAAVIATDAIDSDAIAPNAITEIQNGLATAAALATVATYVDTEITTLQTDVSAILADTGTDGVVVATASKTGYALSTAGVDEIFDELRAGHNVVGSYGESFFTLESGAAIAGTLSTTQMSTNLTEATDDHYKGRIVIFTSGALLRQATDITAYNGTTKVLTFTALTEAPAAADKFIIV